MKYYECKSYRFQVAETVTLDLLHEFPDINFDWFTVKGNKITIQKGYAWDGASGPTIDTKNTIKASLIHDCLYQAMRLGILDQSYRKAADKELRDQMKTSKFRAKVWYLAVRLFAAGSAKKNKLQKKEIVEIV